MINEIHCPSRGNWVQEFKNAQLLQCCDWEEYLKKDYKEQTPLFLDTLSPDLSDSIKTG
jgi:hypothetical protein